MVGPCPSLRYKMVREGEDGWTRRYKMVRERGRMAGQGDTKWLERGGGWLDREIRNG